MKNHFSKHFSDDSLIAHLDGELSARQMARVRKHLQSCWRCRLRLSDLEQQILAVTRAVQEDHFPGVSRIAAAKQRFLDASAQLTMPPARDWSIGWLRRLSPGLAAAGLAIAATSWFWYGAPAPRPKTVVDAPRKIEVQTTTPEGPQPVLAPVTERVEPPSPTDLASIEIEVRYALHQAGTCMGEPVEVERSSDGTIRVRGTAPNEERRLAWLAALSSVRRTPWLKVELNTVEQTPPPLESTRAQTLTAPAAAAEPPIQGRLEEYFAAQSERSRRAAALSNEVVTHAETMLAHAWALRRLDQQYGGDKAVKIPATAAHLLHVMTSEHIQGLRAETQFLLRTAGPVLQTAVAQGGVSEDSDLSLFERSQHVHALLMRLFTTAGAGEDVGVLTRTAMPELRGLDRAAADIGPLKIAKEVK
jgi:hypothetical protein